MNISEHVLSKLKCARCHLYLSIGPVTTNLTNFFCGRCPNGGATVKIYEVLAENFSFPCRYSGFGCVEMVKWGLVQQHEQQCVKKPHLCPAVPPGLCLWRGTSNDVPGHFQQSHTECIIDVNVVQIKLHHNNQHHCVLIKYKGIYLFRVHVNKPQNVLKINLTPLNGENVNKGSYRLKLHSPDFSKHLTLPLSQLQYHESSTDPSNTEDEHVIDMDVLKFLTIDSENPSILCEVVLETAKNKINNDFVKLLECPVCNEDMKSPIYQCKTGHSFCEFCVVKLKDCPLCHEELTKTRNYALEDLATQLYHSCKNANAGCTFMGFPDQLEQHERYCSIYTCPLKSTANCPWSGNYDALVVHCRDNHMYLEAASYGLTCNLTIEECGVFRLIYFDGVFFRVCRKSENRVFCVIIQFVGPAEQADNYLYEFSLVSINNGNTEMCLKDACRILTNDDDVFNDSFRIPFSVLKPFEIDNRLKCNIRIVKRDDARHVSQ